MVPIELEESAGPDRPGDETADPLCRVVQVTLAIYLLPVVAIVWVIGATSIVIDRAARLASRLTADGRPTSQPGHLPTPRARSRAMVPGARSRARVGR